MSSSLLPGVATPSLTAVLLAISSDQLSLARSIVKRFHSVYPPSLIGRSAIAPLPSKALVRMVPRHEIRPDPLPPHLLFPDLALLHHRYQIYQQEKGMAYVKWVCQTYEGALHRYRRAKQDETAEGKVRRREAKFDARLRWIHDATTKKVPDKRLRKGLRNLEDFEGKTGAAPEDLKFGSQEWKILRAYGQSAVDKYRRGLRQFGNA